jgi:hypothetical protein
VTGSVYRGSKNSLATPAGELTTERVRHSLSHLVQGPVARYDFQGFNAMDFAYEAAASRRGGMASLRNATHSEKE